MTVNSINYTHFPYSGKYVLVLVISSAPQGDWVSLYLTAVADRLMVSGRLPHMKHDM